MNKTPNQSATDHKTPMLPEEISQVFSQLGLQKEEDREKLRSLADAKQSETETVRIFLSGTTSSLKEVKGGSYA